MREVVTANYQEPPYGMTYAAADASFLDWTPEERYELVRPSLESLDAGLSVSAADCEAHFTKHFYEKFKITL